MHPLSLPAIWICLLACLRLGAGEAPFGIVIHGGAGAITAQRLGPEGEKARRAGLERALAAGYALLEKGRTSVDAVEAAVRVLEEDPGFNAGVGATVTSEGVHELDAAIMDGRTLAAGAVTGLRHVRSPVSLARRVMERSPHVLLAGDGAAAFAWAEGVEKVPNSTFSTPAVLEAHRPRAARGKDPGPLARDTVGAVALDRQGHLAAATSTGGLFNKHPGRVGDAPLPGAGTYADDATCAVSCTGTGECFIRAVAAHDVAARMAYGHQSLADAAQQVLDRVRRLGGDGGLVALDARGRFVLPFNTPGMFRGHHMGGGPSVVVLYGEAAGPQ